MSEATSFEGMVGRAILGDEAEKELQLARIDCKTEAMTRMFCNCGTILDQKKVHILRDQNKKDLAVCCTPCRVKAMAMLTGKKDLSGLKGWTFTSWSGTVSVIDDSPAG